jgi:hypothetical protein
MLASLLCNIPQGIRAGRPRPIPIIPMGRKRRTEFAEELKAILSTETPIPQEMVEDAAEWIEERIEYKETYEDSVKEPVKLAQPDFKLLVKHLEYLDYKRQEAEAFAEYIRMLQDEEDAIIALLLSI